MTDSEAEFRNRLVKALWPEPYKPFSEEDIFKRIADLRRNEELTKKTVELGIDIFRRIMK